MPTITMINRTIYHLNFISQLGGIKPRIHLNFFRYNFLRLRYSRLVNPYYENFQYSALIEYFLTERL